MFGVRNDDVKYEYRCGVSEDEKDEGLQNAPVRPVGPRSRRLAPTAAESIERAKKARIANSRAWDCDDGLLATEAPSEPAHAEELEDDIEIADRMTRRANENRGRRPRIISVETMGDLDGTWEVKPLYYYAYNDVLATEDGEVIDDIGWTVGDCLEKYGFANDASQREIIVQNFDFSTVYEIAKVLGEYDAGLDY